MTNTELTLRDLVGIPIFLLGCLTFILMGLISVTAIAGGNTHELIDMAIVIAITVLIAVIGNFISPRTGDWLAMSSDTIRTLRNLIGGVMYIGGAIAAVLVTFFAIIGLIWGYMTMPNYSPDFIGLFWNIGIWAVGFIIIASIGGQISPKISTWAKAQRK